MTTATEEEEETICIECISMKACIVMNNDIVLFDFVHGFYYNIITGTKKDGALLSVSLYFFSKSKSQ